MEYVVLIVFSGTITFFMVKYLNRLLNKWLFKRMKTKIKNKNEIR